MNKFKIWDKHHKVFIDEKFGLSRYFTMENGVLQLTPDYVIVPFTGLKDKNGKDIYEGDIIKTKGYQGWFDETGYYYNKEIRHDVRPSGETELSGYLYVPVDREIIGNIHETIAETNT